MKVRDVIKILNQDGWVLVRTSGSHRQFKHSEKQGVVIPIPKNKTTDAIK